MKGWQLCLSCIHLIQTWMSLLDKSDNHGSEINFSDNKIYLKTFSGTWLVSDPDSSHTYIHSDDSKLTWNNKCRTLWNFHIINWKLISISLISIGTTAFISNYIPKKGMMRLHLKGGSVKHSLKLGHGCAIASLLFYIDMITYPCPNMILVQLISVNRRCPRCKVVYFVSVR